MQELAVIIGASSGIGQALTLKLAQMGYSVLAISRKIAGMKDLNNIEVLSADISTHKGRMAVKKYLLAKKVKFLVHCAVEGQPLDYLTNISVKAWRYAQQVNVEAPLFLTQLLLPNLHGGRVLFLSSAKTPTPGMGCYGVSKAALVMLYHCLQKELIDYNVNVGCALPGNVDTRLIDAALKSSKQLEIIETLQYLKNSNQLLAPSTVADFLIGLLTKTSSQAFSEKEWTIEEWVG